MNPRLRHLALRPSACAAVMLALAAPLTTSSVFAQTSSAHVQSAPLSDSLKGPAKDAYESGKLLAANHDFAGALAKFDQAYGISQDPRLLYNMAVCNKELRHYARMQALLEKYSHDAGAAMTPDSRAAVEQALAAIRPLVASVSLTVSEVGASVSVDGEVVGTTPLAAPLAVDLGKHTLTVAKTGFDTAEQPLDAPGGGSSSVNVTLTASKHGAQILVAAEEEATVVIDDTVVGKGRYEGQLAAGTHQVRVTETGKVPYASEVEVHDGERRTIEVTLVSAEHHAPIWPWVVGGVVVAAGAAVGGYFIFKPHDQSAPPPSGALGAVTFDAFGR